MSLLRGIVFGVAGLLLAGGTVWAQSLSVDGAIESTVGGFRFPDGSLQARAFDVYAGVLTVAQSGGDFSSIQVAIDSAAGDAAADNRYLVLVAPGEYEESVDMAPFVDVRGSGVGQTVITAAGSAAADTGTVVVDAETVLEGLSVVNTGGNLQAIGILCSASATLRHLSVSATGASSESQGILITGGAPAITDAMVTASGASVSTGIANSTGGLLVETRFTRLEVTATGGVTENTGILNIGGNKPVLTDVVVDASGGGVTNRAIRCQGPDCRLIRVRATVTGAGTLSQAVSAFGGSSLTIRDSVLSAAGATSTYGIHLDSGVGAASVLVERSDVVGNTTSIRTATGYEAFVAYSQLGGGAVDTTAGGSVTCVAVWDEAFVGSGGTCP